MYQIANATASILRGTTKNAYGDDVPSGTVVASGITAYFAEDAQTVFDPATQAPRIVRTVSGLVPSTTDITEDDQIRDDTTGITYAIQAVVRPSLPGRAADLQLALRRTT
ncbi:MAG: hypothetical protein JWO67_831 [Streptosporangiaceae bacterium]|nr:hypothetical protein [Streptosporangiaceae bacterium]